MPKPIEEEKAFVLRIPKEYIVAIDSIVSKSKGKIKSRNSLIVDLIATFLKDLEKQAQKEAKKGGE